jgi:PAS domain S-box-containing protein
MSPGPSRRTTVIVAVCAAVGVGAAAWLWLTAAPRWSGDLRVGFRDFPPFYYLSTDGRPQGLAVDVIKRAADRAGYSVDWVFLSGPSYAALAENRIDAWPTVPIHAARNVPHVTDPWLQSAYFLVYRRDQPVHGKADVAGQVVTMIRDRLEGELAETALPGALPRFVESTSEKLDAVCRGSARAAFVEGREGQGMLLARPPACADVKLGFFMVDGAALQYGIGSTTAAAHVVDRLRGEIAEMTADGTLAAIHAGWSFTTANELLFAYAAQQAGTRARVARYGLALLAVLLALALFEIRRSRQARRVAEDHARQEERYRVLFERNVAGVFRTDVGGRILDCNDAFARMLGCASRDEVMRRQAWEFYPERGGREAVLALLRSGRSITNLEVAVKRADGRSAVLLESATLIDTIDGAPPVIEGTVLDITRQRELEEQYRQAQRLESIGLLAGGVAHDFNNSLTAISGYAELSLASLPEDDPGAPMLREIQRAAQHAASLTRQLLAFSRRQHLQPEIINLNVIIGDIRGLLRRVIGEDVTLDTHLDPLLANVRADPGQIQQVIMNLAVNARDAMPAGGRLTITTSNISIRDDEQADSGDVAGAVVRVAVTDTGHGIDPQIQTRVFEPFFTTKERGRGTGLGLSTVYGIVKQSGGHIRLRSAPGLGTTFEVDLPSVFGVAVSATVPKAVEFTALRGEETILVVEDQDDVRRIVLESLAHFGYRVLEAEHGEAAIALCRSYPQTIHLLLADVVMPGMPGPAVAEACVRLRPALQTLFMSGYTDNVLQRELTEDQSARYIQKPFTPAQLAAKVRAVLG